MKLEKTAAIAEIVSSIAIVATLAYLAIQSQQTNNMLVGNSRQAALQADLQLVLSTLNNPEVAARILALDDVEQVQNQALLIHLMRTREYQWLQHQTGTLDLDSLESYMTPVDAWLSSEIGAAWWATNQRGFDREFAGFVNSFLERLGP